MEVLISMFILAVGLLGVAALIPAGRHEIVEATKLDNAAMVGRGAFRDMQVRGFLNPAGWMTFPSAWEHVYKPNANAVMPFTAAHLQPPTYNPAIDPNAARQAAFVIDPLGLTAPSGAFFETFPHSHPMTSPLQAPPLLRVMPFDAKTLSATQRYALFDSVFRSSFDQILEPNATNKDFPPSPKWFGGNSRRASDGNYSWIATIVSDPTRLATTGDVTVSVAVFYKRDLTNPDAAEAYSEVGIPTARLTSGASITINTVPTVNGKLKPLKPGQWFMLAGSNGATTDPNPNILQYNYYAWYKVIAAAPIPAGATSQQVTIAGSDWNVMGARTRAFIFDNIVNVYEKQMPLEVQ